jgi:hypothetical protein
VMERRTAAEVSVRETARRWRRRSARDERVAR